MLFHDFDSEIQSLSSVTDPTPVVRELLEGFIVLDAVNSRLFQLQEVNPAQVELLVGRVGDLANRLAEKHTIAT